MADLDKAERIALLDQDSEDEEDDFFLKGPTTKGKKFNQSIEKVFAKQYQVLLSNKGFFSH